MTSMKSALFLAAWKMCTSAVRPKATVKKIAAAELGLYGKISSSLDMANEEKEGNDDLSTTTTKRFYTSSVIDDNFWTR